MNRHHMTMTLLTLALVLSLGLAALPTASARAAASADNGAPPEDQVPVADRNARLEAVWARQLEIFDRQGSLIDRSGALIDRLETLIARAQERGLDTAAVEAALEGFAAAVQQAHPVHQSGSGIVNSHQGFDGNGLVTDPQKARQTVQELGANLREFRTIMGGSGQALREAVQAFRQAHQPQNNE